MITFNNKTYTCTSEIFFDHFNDRQKLRIIWYLENETLRFTALLERLQPLTKKTLTIKLKELEALHLIKREAFPEVPPRVEYSLTEQGQALKPVIAEILIWSQHYAKQFALIGE
jgi:DNA-binding HxlR family transcriptional regulator